MKDVTFTGDTCVLVTNDDEVIRIVVGKTNEDAFALVHLNGNLMGAPFTSIKHETDNKEVFISHD